VSENAQGAIVYRITQALTGIVIAAFGGGGYLGLRAVFWRQNSAEAILSGALAAALLFGVPSLLYVIIPYGLRRLRPDWVSIQIGALVGAVLYGGFNAVVPVAPASFQESAMTRAVQGGIDGLLIGAVTGLIIAFVGGRSIEISRAGCVRYLTLFVLVVCAFWVALLVYGLGGIFSQIAFWLLLPLLLLALKWGITYVDRRRYDEYNVEASSRYEEWYGDDTG
jgi:hypothetical protein